MCHWRNKTPFTSVLLHDVMDNANGPGTRPGPFSMEFRRGCCAVDQVLSPRTLRMKSLEFEVAGPPLAEGTVWEP